MSFWCAPFGEVRPLPVGLAQLPLFVSLTTSATRSTGDGAGREVSFAFFPGTRRSFRLMLPCCRWFSACLLLVLRFLGAEGGWVGTKIFRGERRSRRTPSLRCTPHGAPGPVALTGLRPSADTAFLCLAASWSSERRTPTLCDRYPFSVGHILSFLCLLLPHLAHQCFSH